MPINKEGGATRLAWSDDRARTWTFATWQFTESGLLGFVNYGRGYEGARDDFVYAYSHDGPKADTPTSNRTPAPHAQAFELARQRRRRAAFAHRMQPDRMPSRTSPLGFRHGLVAAIFLATSAPGLGAEAATPKPTLESYLVRLGYQSIPLEMSEDNHLKVRGELQGKRRVFLLDTGWSMTTLNRSIARKLKTLGERGGSFEDSLLGKIDDPSVLLLDLRLGQATFTNQPAVSSSIQSDGRAVGDGVLGSDFLFRNHCLVDCGRQRLFVRGATPPRDVCQSLELTLRLIGYQPIALDRDTDLLLTVRAKANEHPVRLLVDTGATYSILDRSQTRRLRLRTIDTETRIVGVGRTGSAALHAATLNSLELGEFSLRNVMFGVTDLSGWGIGGRAKSGTDLQGILGADQLFLNAALIDFSGLKLWLRPAQPSKPTE